MIYFRCIIASLRWACTCWHIFNKWLCEKCGDLPTLLCLFNYQLDLPSKFPLFLLFKATARAEETSLLLWVLWGFCLCVVGCDWVCVCVCTGLLLPEVFFRLFGGIWELLLKMPLPNASPQESHWTSLSTFFSSFRTSSGAHSSAETAGTESGI